MNEEQNQLAVIKMSLDDSKAADIITLDVHEISSVTDQMIICSGRSTRHVKAIADRLVYDVKQHGMQPLSVNGENTAQWVLIDCGDIIVHIMLPEVREHYALEKLWSPEADGEALAE